MVGTSFPELLLELPEPGGIAGIEPALLLLPGHQLGGIPLELVAG